MRQYGDKESAAEVLTIRNNGRLSEASHAMEEGININCLGHILSMKCLESGHLVTSSLSNNEHSLNVWDMSKGREQAMVPVARLNINPKSKLWFDVAGMDICSVDDDGAIQKYDVYNTLSASKHTQTNIDKGVSFYCSSIAVSSHDECVLVGSDEFAQIAHWDPRSPKSTVFTTQSCRRFNTTDLTRKSYDPVFGVQWNPSNSNEFLSVHKSAMRVWDVRKMDSDLFSTQHDVARPIRSAKWSPHRTDCIAGLTMDGQIKIWNIRKVDGPADLGTPIMQPDLLLEISDFDWCPYVEDVISTVSPSTLEHDGGIQVWRPRNLHDSNDNGEP
ncbi:hypothetical protein BGX31_007758 [Mortierella sp. GBA43]|nr:hypothetical protein BGX31_007758 [Mortierella sp. GBA43]